MKATNSNSGVLGKEPALLFRLQLPNSEQRKTKLHPGMKAFFFLSKLGHCFWPCWNNIIGKFNLPSYYANLNNVCPNVHIDVDYLFTSLCHFNSSWDFSPLKTFAEKSLTCSILQVRAIQDHTPPPPHLPYLARLLQQLQHIWQDFQCICWSSRSSLHGLWNAFEI